MCIRDRNKDDIEKLKSNLKELENVDVEKELEAHKILDDWHKLDKEQRQLQKDKSNLVLWSSKTFYADHYISMFEYLIKI